MNKVGIYLHVPFCRSKCGYCDFYSLPSLQFAKGYYEALLAQIGCWSRTLQEQGDRVDTVYIGGGTPTALPRELLPGIAKALAAQLRPEPDAEWTVEANPATVDRETLSALRRIGVNRLSFGLQSAVEKELRCLGRIHSFAEFRDSFRLARDCGFENISVDLMLGIPYQTSASLSETLRQVTALSPTHLSAYGLRIEEGTPFAARRETLPLPDEDAARELYLQAVRQLEGYGYRQYEISNFAFPGYESRHNLRYWRLEPYVGFGPAAHSDYGGYRFATPADLPGFLAAGERGFPSLTEAAQTGERISERDRRIERLMLGLRLREGVPVESITAIPGVAPKLSLWQSLGLCRTENGRLSFTPEGMLLSNTLLSDLLLLLEREEHNCD